MVDWSDSGKFSKRKQDPRLTDLAEVVPLSDGKVHELRLIGPARMMAVHWIEIKTKVGKTRIPKICLGWDPDKEEFNGPCPYCDELEHTPGIQVISNAIDRDAQDSPPRKIVEPSGSEKKLVNHFGEECYLMSGKDSPTWTPVKLISITSATAQKIADRAEGNKRSVNGKKQKFPPNDPDYGFDISIRYDKNRAFADRYIVERGDNSELSDEELDYPRWRLDLEQPKTMKEAKADIPGLKKVMIASDKRDDDEDEEDEDDNTSRRTSRSSVSRRSSRDEDEDDGRSSRKSSRNRDEDDDDNRGSRKSSRRSRDEDEDDGRSSSRRGNRGKQADDDEDDDNWDDDE